MTALFAFACSRCGTLHEGSPSFGFLAPDQYASLSDEQKERLATLTEDVCIIADGDGTDRFVRAVLEVPIHGVDDPFLWGVWVSLSEKSFDRYLETSDDPVEGEAFFGWVCNDIALYPSTRARPADVVVRSAGMRPRVVLHRGDREDDPLVVDQVSGISIARAQELAERALHGRSTP
jgi:hypothetical protein